MRDTHPRQGAFVHNYALVRSRAFPFLFAAVIAVTVTGCTSGPSPTPAPTGTSAEDAVPTAPAVPTATAAPSATVRPSPAPIPGNIPVDSGAREHATGPVTNDATGTPIQYVVAADDNSGAICNRLGVHWWQLETASGELLGTYPMLYPDDVLTITVESGSNLGTAGNAAQC
jgi:hypothetical protein